jgi:hypothetical protein
MAQFPDNHRGHTIFSHASGPTGGPWAAFYSAWKIEPNNSYRLTVQGALPGTYKTTAEAQAAAFAEAKSAIDAVLK